MATTQCRVCGCGLAAQPLLRYGNMPAAAQCMPDAATVKDDKPVDVVVHQCRGCGLVQLSNDPVPYYREVIRAAAFSPEMRTFRVDQFKAFVGEHALTGRKIIEIGCGKGEYLSLMRDAGADAHGLEYSGESVRYCHEQGLKVEQGFIQDAGIRLNQAPFDAFFFLNFLEHFPDPNQALRGICANLTDGGVGLVEVPNFDMIIRKRMFSEFIGDHLLYFTRETLSSTLQLNGFDVLDCRPVWHDYILSAVVRKRAVLDLRAFHDMQARLKADLEAYIGRFKGRGVAIWGAGHQALAVMALADLGGKIKYVVDSAPFKQGKYTPATHLRIVPPETLVKEPVEAVIIMAASYSDEVQRIIRRDYGGTIQSAILRDYGLE